MHSCEHLHIRCRSMDASDRALREGLDGTARSSVIVALSVARGPRGSETRGSWQPALEASAHWGPEATGPKASPEEYNAVMERARQVLGRGGVVGSVAGRSGTLGGRLF